MRTSLITAAIALAALLIASALTGCADLRLGALAFSGTGDQWSVRVELEEGKQVYYYTDRTTGREFRCEKIGNEWQVSLKDPKSGLWLAYDSSAKGGLSLQPLPPLVVTSSAK
jgi:hypothetical protein